MLPHTDKIHAMIASVYERLPVGQVPVTEVYVPLDKPASKVHYTDPIGAERIGLHEMRVPTGRGETVDEEDGILFIQNLWKGFIGNTYIYCEPAVDGHVFVPLHPNSEEKNQ